MNAYSVETGPKADAQLEKLNAAIGASVERKILWLAQKCRDDAASAIGRNAG
jgi:hypothetical protein